MTKHINDRIGTFIILIQQKTDILIVFDNISTATHPNVPNYPLSV